MTSLSRELVFLILQFLNEEKHKETAHKLEQESGFFFNMEYFEKEVQNGNLDEVEKYLSAFTKVDDNRYSMKIFFEIRKQKYLEALDKKDWSKAVEILVKDLKIFSAFNEDLFKEITQLLTLNDFRDNEQLSKYGDTKSARAIMFVELKKLVEANPLFRDKLEFPIPTNSRLRTLINQSLNWQHGHCKNPSPNPDIKTLFVDHSCGQPNGADAPSPANNCAPMPLQATPAPVPSPLAGCMSNPPTTSHPTASGIAIGLGSPSIPAAPNHSRTPTNPTSDYPSEDSDLTDEPAVNTISPMAASGVALVERVASVGSMSEVDGDARNFMDVKPRITEIREASKCQSLKLPENMRATKILRLIYTNSGNAILALASNAKHLLWKWQKNDRNSSGKAMAGVSPQLWQPTSGILMTNDMAETNPEESVACFALSKNDAYVMSASGGKISLFNMMTFETMTTFMPPPPAATFLAFHPQDNNIIAIGMDDSTIQIHNVRVDEVKSRLKGHSKRITGLAFSDELKVLVSSGADAQICVWSSDGWEKQNSRYVQLPPGRTSSPQSDTRVQFHHDQIHFLVIHETQLSIYETTKLERVKQWIQCESSALISDATFSCDSQLIYASFLDATVCVFTASDLRLCCCINPIGNPTNNLNVQSDPHPLVIAAHPEKPNQFALGLSDGNVHVVEPLESDGQWGIPPLAENSSTSTIDYVPGCEFGLGTTTLPEMT